MKQLTKPITEIYSLANSKVGFEVEVSTELLNKWQCEECGKEYDIELDVCEVCGR